MTIFFVDGRPSATKRLALHMLTNNILCKELCFGRARAVPGGPRDAFGASMDANWRPLGFLLGFSRCVILTWYFGF